MNKAVIEGLERYREERRIAAIAKVQRYEEHLRTSAVLFATTGTFGPMDVDVPRDSDYALSRGEDA